MENVNVHFFMRTNYTNNVTKINEKIGKNKFTLGCLRAKLEKTIFFKVAKFAHHPSKITIPQNSDKPSEFKT